jgi:hypothetical protein
MNIITKEALDFANEAKARFEDSSELVTYRNKESDYIALRGGMFEDSIMIYELGNAVGNFVGQLPRQDKVLVDREELKKLKDVKSTIELGLKTAEKTIRISTSDYSKGFAAAVSIISYKLNKN